MQVIAENKFSGKCLSDVYINDSTKLKWKCKKGHVFLARPNTVKRGHWCSCCSHNKKSSLEECNSFAKSKNGKCLSLVYENQNTKMEWMCKYNHAWSSTFGNVKYGFWCPHCAQNIKHTISYANNLANIKDGKCLSTEYRRARDKLTWECKKEHTWEASLDSVRRGSWCPQCYSFKTETWCREAFENYLNNTFIKIRPDWLENKKTKRNLELDGYCESLNLAFEYNGAQHYRVVEKFKHTEHKLKKQKERDLLKKQMCLENNTKLIIVSEIEQPSRDKVFKKVKSILKKEKLL